MAMEMSPQATECVVDGAVIDTGSNIISSMGLLLLPVVRVANMRSTESKMGNRQKRMNGSDRSVGTLCRISF